MKFNVYTVKDTVGKVHAYRGLFYVGSDEDFVRTSLFSILMDFPLRDIEVYQIGEFDDDIGEITTLKEKRKIDLNCYKFPHSRLSPEGENITLEDVSKSAKEFKAQKMAELKSNQFNEVEDKIKKSESKKENK